MIKGCLAMNVVVGNSCVAEGCGNDGGTIDVGVTVEDVGVVVGVFLCSAFPCSWCSS